MPELTHEELAGIFVCIQGTVVGRWSIYGMGNEARKDTSSK